MIPYVAITIFIAGHIWRYRRDQFGWTSRSIAAARAPAAGLGQPTVPLRRAGGDRRPRARHPGPRAATNAIGIHEHAYHLVAAIAGGVAGAATLIGLLILVYRRATVRRVAVTTTCVDLLAYSLLMFMIGLGVVETSRSTRSAPTATTTAPAIGMWFRGLFAFQTRTPTDRRRAPLVYQIHAISAWAILRAVAVQPPRARLEHPAAVHRPPLHPLSPPLPDRPLMQHRRVADDVLQRILAAVPPASGAVVMGTGIVSIALSLDGSETLSRVLLALAACVWVALGLLLPVASALTARAFAERPRRPPR